MTATDQPTPRVGDTITTAEQIDALPVGSVIGYMGGAAHREYYDGDPVWRTTGGGRVSHARNLAHFKGPLTVLFHPDAPHPAEEEPQIDLTPTPEQRAEQIEFARESQRRRVAVTMTGQGDLAEQGRRLASEREDLIAQGVNPAELEVPLHPAGEAVDRRLLAIAGQALDSWDQAAEDTDDVALDAARTMADALRALVRHGYALAAARAGEAVDREALIALADRLNSQDDEPWLYDAEGQSERPVADALRALAARGAAAPSEVEWGWSMPGGVNVDSEQRCREMVTRYADVPNGGAPKLMQREVSEWREVQP